MPDEITILLTQCTESYKKGDWYELYQNAFDLCRMAEKRWKEEERNKPCQNQS